MSILPTPEAALYELLFNRLNNGPYTDERVYPYTAPAGVVRPYILFFIASDDQMRITRGNAAADFTVTIKGVATSLVEAMGIAAWIASRLDYQGKQDGGDFPNHALWAVKTITKDRSVDIQEFVNQSEYVYHRGNQYNFMMEEI